MDGSDQTRKVRVGRYQVIDEIGSGGFSNVYRAHDPVLDREVAIKVMRPFLMSEPEFVVRFQREAKTAANLDHPHIVPIHDHGETEGHLYIVMKLMPGGSLGVPLAKGPLPWEQILSLTGEIAAALDYAHKHGLVHRDIKPENVLLDARGQAQVADFGVVKALEKSTTTLSMSGGILGSPAYIAPEIWNGKPPTGAADIYALTCLVFEMVTGRKLYDAPTPPAAMALHFRSRQYPESWPENTPPGLQAVLDRGLARHPEERYATATELAEALAALEEDPLAESYEALLAAVESEKWPDAVELAEAISAQDRDYRDVRQLMAQATRARADMERMVWVNQWRDRANAAAKAGEWQLALTAAMQWLQLSPDDSQAKEAMERAEKALEATKKPALDDEPAIESPDPLATTYTALREAFEEKDWEQAMTLAQNIVAQDPGYRDVQDYLDRAKAGKEAAEKAAEIERLKAEAESAMSARAWRRALTTAEAWQGLDPDDPDARQMIHRANVALGEEAAKRKEKLDTETRTETPSVGEYFSNYRRRLRSGDPGLLPTVIILIVLALAFQVIGGNIFDPRRIASIISQTAVISSIAIGVFFVLILGEIDLSVGAIAALSGFVLAYVSTAMGLPALIAIFVGLILAALVGFLQGLTITKFNLPSYMVTLAGLFIVTGILSLFTIGDFLPIHSETIMVISGYRLPSPWSWILAIGLAVAYGFLRLSGRGIGDGDSDSETPRAIVVAQVIALGLALILVTAITHQYEGIPLIGPILLVIFLAFSFVTSRTKLGRDVYAIGRDSEAARQAGIDVNRRRVMVFTLSGLMAGLGGVIMASRIGGSPLGMDTILLLMAIAAPIIGGTSVFGGRGRVMGVLLGGLFVAVIDAGADSMSMRMGIWVGAFLLGLVFALALVADAVFHRRRLRAGRE